MLQHLPGVTLYHNPIARAMFTIIPVKTRRQFADFLQVPIYVNRGNPLWVPPLKISVKDVFADKNPFWQLTEKALFVAYYNGKAVGRIAAFFPENGDGSEGHFGFLEAVNEAGLFSQLLSTAENWLKTKSCTTIKGPFNPGLNYELGILTDGFDRQPYFMMSYNAPYYDGLITGCGYQKEMDFFAYELTTKDFQVHEKMFRVNTALRKRHQITFQNVDFKHFKTSSATIRSLYNDAFREHYGYVPFEEREFDYMAKDMTQVIDPRLLFMIVIDGETAGFILALPNLNEALQHVKNGNLFPFGLFRFLYYKTRVKTVRVINIAIRRKFQHLGLGSLLYEEMVRRLCDAGYAGGEMSWVIENNVAMNKAARDMGGRITKTYRIYQKQLT